MPAYKVVLTTPCMAGECSRTAEYEVFNSANARFGKFCTKHANELVAELNKPRLLSKKDN